MIISISRGKKKLKIDVDEVSFFRRGIGLMFRTSQTRNLLFGFSSARRWAITSWFVFFPFLAVWLDEKYEVQEVRVVYPFFLTLKPRLPYRYLVELPLNERNRRVIAFLVGK